MIYLIKICKNGDFPWFFDVFCMFTMSGFHSSSVSTGNQLRSWCAAVTPSMWRARLPSSIQKLDLINYQWGKSMDFHGISWDLLGYMMIYLMRFSIDGRRINHHGF